VKVGCPRINGRRSHIRERKHLQKLFCEHEVSRSFIGN
jgi:hypothetical protein